MSRYLLLFSCLILTACDDSSKNVASAAAAASVNVETVKTAPVVISNKLPGRVTASQIAEVRPQVSGLVLKRFFTEGSEVKAGQPLYQIDPKTYQASVNKAKAQFVESSNTYQRYKNLYRQNAISRQELDNAESSYLQNKAELETAQVNLEYTKVRAPISGRIGRSSVTQGALVTSSQTTALATITQLDPIYVDVTESSNDLLALRQAISRGKIAKASDHEAKVKLEFDDGSQFSQAGSLEFSEVQVDQQTGSVTMRAKFPNPSGELLPGMFVRAMLTQGVATQGILIPQRAVMRDSKDYPYVYLVDGNNKVVQQQVQLGQMTQGKWLITQGLKGGEKLIVDGLQNLTQGSQVEPHTVTESSSTTETTSNSEKASLSMNDASAQ